MRLCTWTDGSKRITSIESAHVTVAVSDLAKSGAPYDGEFPVATGEVNYLALADRLDAADIQRERNRIYELANGQPVDLERGFARVSILGSETVALVILGPADAEPILGVVALKTPASSSIR